MVSIYARDMGLAEMFRIQHHSVVHSPYHHAKSVQTIRPPAEHPDVDKSLTASLRTLNCIWRSGQDHNERSPDRLANTSLYTKPQAGEFVPALAHASTASPRLAVEPSRSPQGKKKRKKQRKGDDAPASANVHTVQEVHSIRP